MRSLRGHHLICLHFFQGEGYDRPFVQHLRRVLAEVSRRGVRIVEGVDDVCQACPHIKERECAYKKGEAEIRRLDELALALLKVRHGEEIEWGALWSRLGGVFLEWKSKACSNCDWRSVCKATRLWRDLGD
jgi:hypothetical protein